MHLILAAFATVAALAPNAQAATPLETAMAETETVIVGMTDREWDFTVNAVIQDPGLDPNHVAEIHPQANGSANVYVQPWVLEQIHARDAEGLLTLAHEYSHALNYCASEGEVEAASFTMANVIARRLGWRDRVTLREWKAQNGEPQAFRIVATHDGWERIGRMETSTADC